MTRDSYVWHPNTQMSEWDEFDEIVSGKDMYLIDKNGKKLLDGVASMWCNVWGHSNQRLINSISSQAKKISHAPLFNLTNTPIEKLAENLVKISPGMHKSFFSDNGSSAMEIALKISIQYWKNLGIKKSKIMSLKNGYHGDTFGAMSIGYVPEFFKKFQDKLFHTIQVQVPNKYHTPKNTSFEDHKNNYLDKIEKIISNDDKISAFVMESGAQVAGGVIIYPKGFQNKISKLCKKNNVLLVLDEIATGFGRLGSMIQYVEQNSTPDIVAYGKMLTGGYLTLAATLTTKKVYDTFLGDFYDYKHLFHGHTFTGNPIAANLANENLKLYKEKKLISQIKIKSKVFEKYYDEISKISIVGDIRHQGMLMGIELVKNQNTKEPIRPKKSINKIIFDEGRKNGIYLRTLGNIVMIVPPLAIPKNQLEELIERTISTIKNAQKKLN